MKGCPLLIQSDTEPSLLCGGESHTRTYMLTCVGEKCVAYDPEKKTCRRFASSSPFDDDFAEWKYDPEREVWYCSRYHKSPSQNKDVTGTGFIQVSYQLWVFCPHCGADMTVHHTEGQ